MPNSKKSDSKKCRNLKNEQIAKNLDELKNDIVQFLSNCPGKRIEQRKFWNSFQRFSGKSRPKYYYGVKNLNEIFHIFDDAILSSMDFIKLKEHPTDKAAPWGSGAQVKSAKDGNRIVIEIDSDSDDSDMSEIEMTKSTNNNSANVSEFIAFADADSPQANFRGIASSAQAAQSRYGLSSSSGSKMEPPIESMNFSPGQPAHSRYGLPSSSGSKIGPSIQSMTFSSGLAAHSRYELPSSSGENMKSPYQNKTFQKKSNADVIPPQPVEVEDVHPLQSMVQNFTSKFLQSYDPGVSPINSSPALMMHQQRSFTNTQSDDQPSLSVWPRPTCRRGPPPGTKITEEKQGIVVQTLNIPRNNRLTVEFVNHQLQACIDDLSATGEHVSMERVENFLLQKFKVNRFCDLGLRERNITFLPAGREHSNMLCKVNAHIQNFVRVRSMSTLYELQECMREFHKEQKDFEHLKLGPLQKIPLIFELFKFPDDEYIPEITTEDLMQNLNKFLTKYEMWQKKVELTEFMEYLTKEIYNVEPYSLGIRIRSLPLAIQMLKKASRDASKTRKNVIERLKQCLCCDIQEAFHKFKAEILQQKDSHDTQDLRRHYISLEPEVTLKEIFSKFEILQHIFSGESAAEKRLHKRFAKVFQDFSQVILDLPLPRSIFHLSVCLSNLEVQESVTDFLGQESEKQQQAVAARKEAEEKGEEQELPSLAVVVDKTILYINKCFEYGTLTMKNLQVIETKLIEDNGLKSFSQMGYGSFLQFIDTQAKIKSLLDECGGMSLGGSHDKTTSCVASQLEILEFVCQAKKAGCVLPQQVESVICEHYAVAETRHLGHGNITRLYSAADKRGKHTSSTYNTLFESALCGKSCPSVQFQSQSVGIQGRMSRMAAIACLTNCPLLVDLAEWSHWTLVFQPQHGPLREFIQKYGGLQELSLELDGVKKKVHSDFSALEVAFGKLLKLTSRCSPADFLTSLESGDINHAAGCLVSLIALNGGLENTPLALLANHIKTQLFSLNARTPAQLPTGEQYASEETPIINLAVQFVAEMLIKLPVRIAAAVANQLLLEPLSSVVGSAKSKSEVMTYCMEQTEGQRLELLGCLLGLPEWTQSLTAKCEFPQHLVTLVPHEGITGELDMEEDLKEDDDDEEDAEEDSEDDENDIFEMLLDNEENKSIQLKTSGNTDEVNSKLEENNLSSEEESDDEDEEDESEDEEDQSEDEVDNHEESKSEAHSPTSDEVKTEATAKDRQLTREEICCQIIDNIRRDEFGVGVKLDQTGQKLLKKQQERQGRSLLRLSKDLYSKDTHFVLELIQNADDNTYTVSQPAVKFTINQTGVIIQNNETGFEEKNIRALCDVGKSTKSKHQVGYIGQKGIGFKSVFRVTNRPEVHSNGFHICFDVKNDDMGYILPQWADHNNLDKSWQTHIILPWTDEIKQSIRSHAARFNDIQATLLLFLHRLKEITIKNEVEGNELHMVRRDLENRVVEIQCGDSTDCWMVLKKVLDASKLSLQAKSGVNVESTEIALAFPLIAKNQEIQHQKSLKKLPVFAFLPLRSYGFKFIIQGDFDVPSSREDVDRDSSWNQWLRSEIPHLFVDALDNYKMQPDLSPVEALAMFLQFIPLDGEVIGFFTPVTQHILTLLKDKNCMPVVSSDEDGSIHWKKPSQAVTCQDRLVREILTPRLLHHELGLSYLHPEVLEVLDPALCRALNINAIGVEHLLHIGRFIGLHWNYNNNPDQVMEISKWLACIYRSMDDFEDHTETLNTLRGLKIIPLSCGMLVSLEDMKVFLLSEQTRGRTSTDTCGRDPLIELKKDVKLVHSGLISTPDAEVNSQVVKLLLKLKINQLTPQDLINNHILPVLKSQDWKEKSREVLISYLVYIKSEKDTNDSMINMAELKSLVRLATNHGIKSPTEDDVHFSQSFGNAFNLEQNFPDVKWTLVDSAYISNIRSRSDVKSWHTFLSELGVVDFLCVRQVQLNLDLQSLKDSAWVNDKDVWPSSSDGYVISDWQCDEFKQVVSRGNYSQMETLFGFIDKHWSSYYSRYATTQLKSQSGDILRDSIHTSFSIQLLSSPWIPSSCPSMELDPNTECIKKQNTKTLQQAADVYQQIQEVENLLAHTVKYLNVSPQDHSFMKFLKVRNSVSIEAVKEALLLWSTRDVTNSETPSSFCTCARHITHVYNYLNDHMTKKAAQDLFNDHPVIFVPDNGIFGSPQQPVTGHFLNRQEVWWSDPTDLFSKYQQSLLRYKSPLAKKKILCHLYGHYQDIFIGTARVPSGPSTVDLAQLIDHMAKVFTLLEPSLLTDVLHLFHEIGNRLKKITEKSAGVPTLEAQWAERDLPQVKSILSQSAVFPTLQNKWVAVASRPMLSDSVELEEMFLDKPGVHFLQLEPVTNKASRLSRQMSRSRQENIEYLLSLFEEIKPLSECVETSEITSGFAPCSSGQNYLHLVVPQLQHYLFYSYKQIYQNVKENKVACLKELLFTQVDTLEVKYELKGHQNVSVIRHEKCIVKDHHFYFQKDAIGNQSEINREVAKYFSDGNEKCIRDLRSFLSQVVPILQGKSDESIDQFMMRMLDGRKAILPDSEEIWEVPLPVISLPEPEPQQNMVYGRASYSANDANIISASDPNAPLKSWPPRSADISQEQLRSGPKNAGSKSSSSQWPPPAPPSNKHSLSTLPSTIRFEDEGQREATDKEERRQPKKNNQSDLPARKEPSEKGSSNLPSKSQIKTESIVERIDQAENNVVQVEASHSEGTHIVTSEDDRVQHHNDTRKRKLTDSSIEESLVPKRRSGPEDDSGEDLRSDKSERNTNQPSHVKDGDCRHQPDSRQIVGAALSNLKKRNDEQPSLHTTSSQLFRNQQKRENVLQFHLPHWSLAAEDMSYIKLSEGEALTLPKVTLKEEAQVTDIGRWGEELVWGYLKKLRETDNLVEDVIWPNEAMETGKPYDFEILYKSDKVDEVYSVFVEVKATISSEREVFPISLQQIQFAEEKGEHYQIYRIFGAGNQNNVRLLRVDNVSDRMRLHQIKLLMLL